MFFARARARRGGVTALLIAVVGFGATVHLGTAGQWARYFAASQLEVDYVTGHLDGWINGAQFADDCKTAAESAKKGLDQMGAWMWTDEKLYADDEQKVRVPAYTTVDPTDPDVKAWMDAGMPDNLFPGGNGTVVDFLYPSMAVQLGANGRPIPNERVAFVVAHEALHWLKERGINHTHADFQGLENCVGGF